MTLPTRRPAPSIALRALSSDSPVTSGTATFSLPCETRSVTVLPRSTVVPPAGELSITWPLATSSENSFSTFGSRPAAFSWSCASLLPRPSTVGTATSPGPADTLIVTVEPSFAVEPALRALRDHLVARHVGALDQVLLHLEALALQGPRRGGRRLADHLGHADVARALSSR